MLAAGRRVAVTLAGGVGPEGGAERGARRAGTARARQRLGRAGGGGAGEDAEPASSSRGGASGTSAQVGGRGRGRGWGVGLLHPTRAARGALPCTPPPLSEPHPRGGALHPEPLSSPRRSAPTALRSHLGQLPLRILPSPTVPTGRPAAEPDPPQCPSAPLSGLVGPAKPGSFYEEPLGPWDYLPHRDFLSPPAPRAKPSASLRRTSLVNTLPHHLDPPPAKGSLWAGPPHPPPVCFLSLRPLQQALSHQALH